MSDWVDYIPEIHAKIVSALTPSDEYLKRYESLSGMGDAIKSNLNKLVPSNEAFQQARKGNPQALKDASITAALNAPAIGTFIGPKSKGWDKKNAEIAKQLLDSGADPKQVWKDYLVGKMPDGSLFSEIDDSPAKYLGVDAANRRYDYYAPQGNYDKVYDHPELFKQYPKMKDIAVQESFDNGAAFKNGINEITIGLNGNVHSLAAHENQHAIQEIEGWPKGGSPEQFAFSEEKFKRILETAKNTTNDYLLAKKSGGVHPEYGTSADDLQETMIKWNEEARIAKDIMRKKLTGLEAYKNLTGEAQARATQDRIPLSMEQRRELYPLEGDKISDIPFSQLINRYVSSGDHSSLPETEFSRAHFIAQKRAALPIEQGGLGLPPDNTAIDRAKALGFDTEAYHGRNEGTYLPDDVKLLSDNLRKQAYEIEDKLRNKYGKDEKGYKTELWKDDPLTIEKDDLYERAYQNDKNYHINDPQIKNDSFDPLLSRDLGTHFASSPKTTEAFSKNGMVYPVRLNLGDELRTADIYSRNRGMVDALYDMHNSGAINEKTFNKFIERAKKADNLKVESERDWGGKPSVLNLWRSLNKDMVKNKAPSITYHNEIEGGGDSYAVFDPKNIRSRFAAFDPFNKDSANILASTIGATALASQYNDDDEWEDYIPWQHQ